MRRRSTLLIALTTLIAGTGLTAGSASAVFLGPSSGLTAVRTGQRLDVTFSASALAAAKLRSGSRIMVECESQHPHPLVLVDGATSSDFNTAAAKIGADGVARLTFDFPDEGKPLDVCQIASDRGIVGAAGITPVGATWVDEAERAAAMRDRLMAARGATGYKPVAELGAGVVALDSPDATPPVGQIGYWTDGTHAAVAELSAAGRRLVVWDTGGFVLRSNVIEQSSSFVVFDEVTPGADGSAAPPSDDDGRPSPLKGRGVLTPDDGVHATVRGRRVTVRFSGRKASAAARKLAGRRVGVTCVELPAPALFPQFGPTGSGSGVARVPRRGGAVTVALHGGAGDVCFLQDDGKLVAMTPGTPSGRVLWQDVAALSLMVDTEHLAAAGGKTYKPTAQIVARDPKRYVAMAGPDAAAPRGKVGVWTDGTHRGALATRSASGAVIRLVDEGDGMERTNLFRFFSAPMLSVLVLTTEPEPVE